MEWNNTEDSFPESEFWNAVCIMVAILQRKKYAVNVTCEGLQGFVNKLKTQAVCSGANEAKVFSVT